MKGSAAREEENDNYGLKPYTLAIWWWIWSRNGEEEGHSSTRLRKQNSEVVMLCRKEEEDFGSSSRNWNRGKGYKNEGGKEKNQL